MGNPRQCLEPLIKLTLEEEVCVFQAELQKGNYVLNDMLVLCCRVGSCANFCCTMRMEGSTGTEMKRALTQKDVVTSPGSSLLLWICWTRCCVFLR